MFHDYLKSTLLQPTALNFKINFKVKINFNSIQVWLQKKLPLLHGYFNVQWPQRALGLSSSKSDHINFDVKNTLQMNTNS